MTATAPLPDPTLTPEVEILAAGSGRTSLFRRMLRNPLAAAALLWLTVLVLSAIFASVIAPGDPAASKVTDSLLPPGPGFPLGADRAGHNVWVQLVNAGQFSLLGALLTLVIAVALGVTGGLIAGYFGGWFDTVSSWLAGILMAMPGIIVLLAARAAFGPSMWLSMGVFGVLISPAFFRLVYAAVTAVRNELYVDAARVAGLSDTRIIARHILTVVRAPVIIQGAMVLGIAIAIQAGLEFLGLGNIGLPTWGGLLNTGFLEINTTPALLLWPSLVIGLTCVALTIVGNALRDELEQSGAAPKKSGVVGDIVREHVVVHPEDPAAAAKEVLLQVTDLRVGYDQRDGSVKEVVSDVSFTVHRGEVHGIIGESGSGKTQSAFAIMRLLPEGGRIVGGSILFEGTDLATKSEKEMTSIRGRKIAYIPQEPMSNLDPSFTIGSQLTEPLRIRLGLSKADAKARAIDLLTKVGIPNPERTFRAYPHEVSGGMAQRVLIAGAISCEPDLLIADEPTTALDVTVQAEVLNLLRELEHELDMGVILVTHNFGVVADLCDHVSVMRNGRIVETGPLRSIFANPEHEYTKSLFDAILDEAPARGALPEPAEGASK